MQDFQTAMLPLERVKRVGLVWKRLETGLPKPKTDMDHQKPVHWTEIVPAHSFIELAHNGYETAGPLQYWPGPAGLLKAPSQILISVLKNNILFM